jgi:lipid-binding SYLF domain-containing protein
MSKYTSVVARAILAMMIVSLMAPLPAMAVDPALVDRESEAALKVLYESTPAAREIAGKSKGILVFPNIVKAGFIFGAQYGDGELLKSGQVAGRYNITAVSYGLQAGIQAFAYAMFFMTDSALSYLDRSAGFEVGVGPSVVILDEGMAKTVTTSTLQSDVYGFVFGQKGLMAGVGVQGSKITKIDR